VEWLDEMCNSITTKMDDDPEMFNPQEVVNTLNAMVKLHELLGRPLQYDLTIKLVNRFLVLMDQMTPQGLVMGLNALCRVKQGAGWPDVMELLLPKIQVLAEMNEFVGIELGLTCNALARINYKTLGIANDEECEAFLAALANNAKVALHTFDQQAIANMLNGLGSLGYHDKGLISGMCDQLLKGGCDGDAILRPQHVANALNAMARAQFMDPELIASLCERFAEVVDTAEMMEMTAMINDLGRLGFHSAPWLVEAIAQTLLKKKDSLTGWATANTLNGLSLLKYDV
jgi:hypothetical protein